MIFKNDGSHENDPVHEFRKHHRNDPTSPTKLAIVSCEEGLDGAGPARQIYGILRFDVYAEGTARLNISERGFINLSNIEARLLAEALLEWVNG